MLRRAHEQVLRFNREVRGVPIPPVPRMLSVERGLEQVNHLDEEVSEARAAVKAGDFAGLADACVDVAYVALGTLVGMGIPAAAIFEEVHLANMRKVPGVKPSRPDAEYDAVKPEGWQPPDLLPYLMATREDILAAVQGETTHTDRKPKILVVGHARHGKDTLCEFLRDEYGLGFTSSSMFCAEKVVWPHMPEYETALACFEDRANRRAEWYDLISEFNREDPTTLARAILVENDVYCGMRSSTELHACRNADVFDWIIWVDASRRVPPESSDSCTVEPWMADYVVDANGTVEEAQRNMRQLMERLL